MTDGHSICKPSRGVCVALCVSFLVVNILVGLKLSGYFSVHTSTAGEWYNQDASALSSVPLPVVQIGNLTSRMIHTSTAGEWYNQDASALSSVPLPVVQIGNLTSRLIVFPVFSLLTDSSYNMSRYGKDKPSKERLAERMTDFVEGVQYTLKHEHVAKVIVLYSQDAMPDYIKGRLGSHPKLSFKKLPSTFIVNTIFEYIHEKFQNELVLITNGDVYPGEGFEYVQYDLMKSKRLFYAPTRHGKVEKRCDMRPQNCDKGFGFSIAHDTYIFIPSGPFVEKARRLMQNMRWDDMGMEHVILYSYFHYMQYKIRDPCHVVFMYHNHCSKLRHSVRPTFGNQSVYYDSPKSSNLY